MADYELKLFVAGPGARTDRLVGLLDRLAALVDGSAAVTVVDVAQQPEEAERHGVMATPTLVRLSPLPQRRTVGETDDPYVLARALDIALADAENPQGAGP